jgi:hypothetical protein
MRLATLILCLIDTLFLGFALYEVEEMKHAPPAGNFGDLFAAVLGLTMPAMLVAVLLLTVLPALLLALGNRAPKSALVLALVTPALVAGGMAWLSS